MSDTSQNASAPVSAQEQFEINRRKSKKALPSLLVIFLLGTLMIQAMDFVYQNIGDSLGMGGQAALLTTIPGIILGVACLIYETLGDFISPKRMTMIGVWGLIVGSLMSFCCAWIGGPVAFWLVLVGRIVQVAGAQVAGSVFLVLTSKYLDGKEKARYFGIFNAVYYLAAAAGVFFGGMITSWNWRYIFLLPVLAIFFVPVLSRNTPDINVQSTKLDVIGIIVFGLSVTLLTVYFSYPDQWWLLLAAGLLFVMFALHVVDGKRPFITTKFVSNPRYMLPLVILFVLYALNYAAVPIYQVIGSELFKVPLWETTLYLTVVYVVATIIGVFSGPIVNKLGRWGTMLWSAIFMTIGFALSALFIHASFAMLTFFACIFITGMTAVYTPIYDAGSAAVPSEQGGRAMGVLDLTLNVTGSIGIAIYSAMMANSGFAAHGFFGLTSGRAFNSVANMFWCMAFLSLLGVVIIIASRRHIVTRK
ncbi:MAG: MFS transporter [Bifidobacteriaceae bacterium]|nr:MFS transporter [Bifidobacteriaceae bacterium]